MDGDRVVLFTIGFVVALLLTLAGWKGKIESGPWKNDPRVQSALYALGASLISLTTNWKAAFPDVTQAAITSHYLEGLVFGILIALIGGALIVFFQARRASRINPENSYASNVPECIGNYLYYGYGFFSQRLRSAQEQLVEQKKDENVKFANVARSACAALAGELAIYHKRGSSVTDAHRADVIARLLGNVEEVARPYLTNGSAEFRMNSNLMRAVPFSDDAAKRYDTHFQSADWTYSHLLVLQQYRNPGLAKSKPGFALPVFAGQPRNGRLLPGAPEAFKNTSLRLVGKPDVKGFPEDIQRQIKDFFEGQNFKCFISVIVPLQTDNSAPIVGVVNIETSHASALSDEKLIELFEVLSPTVTLLGIIASEAPLNLNL